MTDSYSRIVADNLNKLYSSLPDDLAENLPADQAGTRFQFDAFGRRCEIRPGGITLDGEEEKGVLGILISLYALHAGPGLSVLEPLKGFKDLLNCNPYVGAFTTHTERILVPRVDKIEEAQDLIFKELCGREATSIAGGDFSFLVRPLPKIFLCYIFYRADEEFPASVTCLFSNNALRFLPVDGLADVGEYTSLRILELIENI